MFSLTTTHLRFVCQATTPLRLEADTFRAGSNLRGALGQVMLRAYCAGDAHDPRHAATCPVHWLLAANVKPGEERRGYALVPPLPNEPPDYLNRGDAFEFGLTLFGSTLQFLPYFILAVPEMGRLGIGPGRGTFELLRVWALNPLTGESECLYGDNGNVVRTPTLRVNHAMVMEAARARGSGQWTMDNEQGARGSGQWTMDNEQGAMENGHAGTENRKSKIGIEFLTPMRLIEKERTVKTPEFAPLFARLLERLDELEKQFGNDAGGAQSGSAEGRSREEVMQLRALAERVELTDAHTRWVEVFSGSARRGQASPLSGFVGRAVFSAPHAAWRELLPWLIWGELAQVGKAAVKGNGVLRIAD